MMLNLLIAYFTGTYEKVIDNMDTEWKFARSQVCSVKHVAPKYNRGIHEYRGNGV